MEMGVMKIKDFIKHEIDIDVYDDYMEVCIAFCGSVELTEEGKSVFADVLDYDIIVYPDYAVVFTCDEYEDVCEYMVQRMKTFFYAAAGYCSESDYDRWFITEE